MGVSFTMWIFNHVDISDVKQDEISNILTSNYLSKCRNKSVTAATTRWAAQGATIAPGRFDAVVFLVSRPFGTPCQTVGGSMTRVRLNSDIRGLTVLGASGGPVAEVYWDRCARLFEVPDAIFHEAAHAKSGLDDPMHQTPGVRTLSEKGSLTGNPSDADIRFFAKAILRPIPLRRAAPQ